MSSTIPAGLIDDLREMVDTLFARPPVEEIYADMLKKDRSEAALWAIAAAAAPQIGGTIDYTDKNIDSYRFLDVVPMAVAYMMDQIIAAFPTKVSDAPAFRQQTVGELFDTAEYWDNTPDSVRRMFSWVIEVAADFITAGAGQGGAA